MGIEQILLAVIDPEHVPIDGRVGRPPRHVGHGKLPDRISR